VSGSGDGPRAELDATAPYTSAAGFGSGVGIGAHVGRYVVKRLVGVGGMGVVVAAQDPELGRMVAIKLVTRNREDARTRLVREAQAMARLSHPNVVTVHEVIRVGGGAGVVMELVEGESLAAWCQARPRGWREIVAAYVQAARGLAAAHRAGLVHRDFKPSNALIDSDGVVRVTDFGLVRATAPSADASPPDQPSPDGAPFDLSLTHTGAMVGTPNYMAPEQHRGDPVDARTDQWALACSLYTALYRQRPFAGDNYQQLSASVLAGELRPEPSDTRVPRSIRAAIRRALSLRPDDRFATMTDLIAALSPSRRAWQIATALTGGAAAAAIAVALAAGGDSGATCTRLDEPLAAVWNQARSAALRGRFASVVGHGELVAGDQAIAALERHGATWLAARKRACTEARQGVGSPELLDRRMRCLDQRLAEMSEVIAALSEADAAVIRGAGGAVDRLHAVEDCDDPRGAARPADPQARAAIAAAEEDLARGWALQALSQYERALPLASKAVEVGERTGWKPLLARALILRGECEDRQRDYTAALATFDRAAIAAAQAQDDPAVVEALAHRFLVLGEHLGRTAEALAGRAYIELALERAGRPPRARAVWLHFLAIMLHRTGQQDAALAAETEAVAIWRAIVPAGHTYLLDSLETEGNIQIERGEFERAEALLGEVLAGKIAARGPDHPAVADTLTNLGVLEANRGRLPAAIAHWERARDVTAAAGIEYFLSAYNLGLARYELGRWRAATDELTVALRRAERDAPGLSRQVGGAAAALGVATMLLGDLDRAGDLLDRAIEAGRAAGATDLAEALALAAQHAILRGDRAAARARLDEAKKHGPVRGLVALGEAELARAEKDCRAAIPSYKRAIADVAAINQQRCAVDSAATVGMAECLIDMGQPAEAIAALEPALQWLGDGAAEPPAMAPAQFALARALVATGGDRRRARMLAEAARAGFAALGPPGQARAADVTRWLARLP
jgi:eukaryotic-like serine/threonine-protein kinase